MIKHERDAFMQWPADIDPKFLQRGLIGPIVSRFEQRG